MIVVEAGRRVLFVALLCLLAVACGRTGPDAYVQALTDEQDIDNPDDRARLLGIGLDYCTQHGKDFDLEVAVHGPKEAWPRNADSLHQQHEGTIALRRLMDRRLCRS